MHMALTAPGDATSDGALIAAVDGDLRAGDGAEDGPCEHDKLSAQLGTQEAHAQRHPGVSESSRSKSSCSNCS